MEYLSLYLLFSVLFIGGSVGYWLVSRAFVGGKASEDPASGSPS